jgi:hypothetical protein
VVVGNLDVVRVAVSPLKTDAILVVYSDAVLPYAIPAQFLQPITRRKPQVCEHTGPVEEYQFT